MDPIDQQYLQALQQHGQNLQEQVPILEQFIRNIQQLLQHQVQAAENSDPRPLQVQPVYLHHTYHPPLPGTQSQTTQSMIQSQVAPTTATTEIQAGSNSPQVSHPPDKKTSEGDKERDGVPSSVMGAHVVDCCNANQSWTEISHSYSAFGQLLKSIETVFLQHLGHDMTLHDIPICMDNLDDFSHRYTANTFQLLSVVAPHPGSFKIRSKVLILPDQGYESIPLIDKTTVILFVRLQERHERHWVLVKADFSTHTLTYYDPIYVIADENDPWLTHTCGEVKDMLRKSVGQQHLDRVRFSSTIIGTIVSIAYVIVPPKLHIDKIPDSTQGFEPMKIPDLWCGKKLNYRPNATSILPSPKGQDDDKYRGSTVPFASSEKSRSHRARGQASTTRSE